ncbi:MFS transporter [Vibrio sp. SS-MA-C1-2]|uniref:MFS transporter n=1 Tax=Vibrio sp. SS-MA-C1-2 TaxID=2908646 RepID=UPI001F3936B7|nr:MFS transporter [Vibrio sp. SS-MA-C1-2]UJF17695.1 MFS transporter [Vibrio sp. SS-MA-C1-2]
MTRVHLSRKESIILLIGIIGIAFNLRAPITEVGPLIGEIQQHLHLSTLELGLLTTLPVLAFAFFSPVASILGHKRGYESALMFSLILTFIGIIVRSLGTTAMLYLGVVIIGAGIAIANVLLPTLLKRYFPDKIMKVTAIYVLVMGVGASLSATFAVPALTVIEHLELTGLPNWAYSLLTILFFAVAAIILWIPQILRSKKHKEVLTSTVAKPKLGYIWRSPIAWQITAFLTMNSFLMYIFINWLPTILTDSGYSAEQAGSLQGLMQLFTSVPAILLIPLNTYFSNKRALTFSMTLFGVLSIAGLLFAPSYSPLWVAVFGFNIGGTFVMGLSFIGLRTTDLHQAAAVSAMSQLIGYLIAATGPLAVGALYQHFGDWSYSLSLCLAVSIIWSFTSLFVAKSTMIVAPDATD